MGTAAAQVSRRGLTRGGFIVKRGITHTHIHTLTDSFCCILPAAEAVSAYFPSSHLHNNTHLAVQTFSSSLFPKSCID